jgi:hypothetical protein
LAAAPLGSVPTYNSFLPWLPKLKDRDYTIIVTAVFLCSGTSEIIINTPPQKLELLENLERASIAKLTLSSDEVAYLIEACVLSGPKVWFQRVQEAGTSHS